MIALVRDEQGNVLVEYALVLSLLSVGFIAGMLAIEKAANTALTTVQTQLETFQLNGQ